jgi:protein TonB
MGSRQDQPKGSPPAYFTLLPESKSRPGTYLAAIVVELVLAVLIVAIGALGPRELSTREPVFYSPVYVPAVERPAPYFRKPVTLPRVAAEKPLVLPAPRPRIDRRRVRVSRTPLVAPVFHRSASLFRTKETPLRRPQPPIHTGVLLPVMAKLPAPRTKTKVEMGGFGQPFDDARPRPRPKMTMDPTGSFNDPEGPDTGNAAPKRNARETIASASFGDPEGTGNAPSRNTRETVASAGFGNSVDSSGRAGSGEQGAQIRAGVFSNKASVPARKAPVIAAKPTVEPLEILAKPNPVYTAAARAHKIQGSVELSVIFTASGRVRVLRVIRGLAYGLNQAAIAAARQIRFRPERMNGKPVSVPARLHIVFRLAY